MQATAPGGNLVEIEDCYIDIGGGTVLTQRILPDISDSKGASYPEEPLMGRSTPLKTYSHSETRTISWTMHFIVCKEEDIHQNLMDLRAICSAVYPLDQVGNAPYQPPNLCHIKCGSLLADDALCAAMKSYSVKFPPDVAWDEETLLPYKFDVDMSFEVVYDSSELPGADCILATGGTGCGSF
jgi:hypothetical protein